MLPFFDSRVATVSLSLILLASTTRTFTECRVQAHSTVRGIPLTYSRAAWVNPFRLPRAPPSVPGESKWTRRHAGSRMLAMSTLKSKKARRAQNVEGNVYVDESCIDCDTCRWMQGDVFVSDGGKSAVARQPVTRDEKLGAYRAMVACPAGSIRLETPDPLVRDALEAFPFPVDTDRLPGVYHMGFHGKESFGCSSWLVARDGGNVVVDSPRINGKLAKALEKKGGIAFMVLSHIDDVADHQRWKQVFPDMIRIMHKADVQAHGDTKNVEMQLHSNNADGQIGGKDYWDLDDDLRILHTPGHSRGSITLLYEAGVDSDDSEGVAFTGDHIGFSGRTGALSGFPNYGWDLELQSESMELLARRDIGFRWILPGHGRLIRFDDHIERISQIQWAAKNIKARRR